MGVVNLKKFTVIRRLGAWERKEEVSYREEQSIHALSILLTIPIPIPSTSIKW